MSKLYVAGDGGNQERRPSLAELAGRNPSSDSSGCQSCGCCDVRRDEGVTYCRNCGAIRKGIR